MAKTVEPNPHLSEAAVRDDLQRQPHLFLKLAENALTVAESLRNNYFKNTTTFLAHLRTALHQSQTGQRTEPLLTVHSAADLDWPSVQGEVVTFIDGSVGRAPIAGQAPLLLRVGSYEVRTGERRLSERERFGYYPIALGDLEGGSKARRDFADIVRLTGELLAGLCALERTPDLRVLMFRGPLVDLAGPHAGHTPFTERDIDLFLHQYSAGPTDARQLKEGFLKEARLDIYPR